jgi:hypothetical protein
MWIFQNNSFISVVAHYRLPGVLLVRSRIEGDIERAIPGAKVFENLDADYRYRSLVSHDSLKEAMNDAIDGIDYGNFKDSIAKTDHKRHGAYMNVWSAMAQAFGAYIASGRLRFVGTNPKDIGYPDDPYVDAFLND